MYLTFKRKKGIPIYCHWSVTIIFLVVLFINGFSIIDAVLSWVSYLILIFIHELGHCFFARRAGIEVSAISLSALGGACHAGFSETKKDALLFYSGGLLFQVILLFLSILIVMIIPESIAEHLKPVLVVFIHINIVLFFMNIIPSQLPGGAATDGKQIFRVIFNRDSADT